MRLAIVVCFFLMTALSSPAICEEFFAVSEAAPVNFLYRGSSLSVTAAFSDPDQYLDPGQTAEILVEITNLGPGNAHEVRVLVSGEMPDGMIMNRSAVIGTIYPDRPVSVKLPITALKQLQEGHIKLQLVLTERYGRFPAPLEIDLSCRSDSSAGEMEKTVIRTLPRPVNIDTEIPRSGISNTHGIAVIIGNRDYQNPEFGEVAYAQNDARIMREYMVNVFGYLPDNIHYIPNARAKAFSLLFGTLKKPGLFIKSIRPDTTEVFVYYRGLGAADIEKLTPYLVPVDCGYSYRELRESACSVNDLFDVLETASPKRLTIVLDTSFNGLGEFNSAALDVTVPQSVESRTALFASTSQHETANPYHEQMHSLFSYVFMRSINEIVSSRQGDISADTLFSRINGEEYGVSLLSNTAFNTVAQTPVFRGNGNLVLLEVAE